MLRRVHFESMSCKTVMNRVQAPSMPFDWSINPYRGCQHGCSFCYASGTHSFLGAETEDEFQHHIYDKTNAPEALEQQLSRMAKSRKKIGHVAIGTATDPYQPAEAKELLTRRCLEVLLRFGVSVSITTRSPLVLRDSDLLSRMKLTSVNISLNTMDRNAWRRMEAATPAPQARLETVRALNEAGIHAGIFLAPVLPHITDREEQLEQVAAGAAEVGARFVKASFLRLNTREVKVWFFQNLERHYPSLVPEYAELYASSAYLPRWYREPKEQLIHEVLRKHGVPMSEMFRASAAGTPKEENKEIAMGQSCPEQLTFSF